MSGKQTAQSAWAVEYLFNLYARDLLEVAPERQLYIKIMKSSSIKTVNTKKNHT